MKKLNKVGYILSGVVLGVALTASLPTMAATVTTIKAKLNGDVKVIVNGTNLSSKPINYNNQNYLPIGDIGRALGANVKFDKSKNAIVVETAKQEMPSTVPTPSNPNTATPEPIKEAPAVKFGQQVVTAGVSRSVDKVEYLSAPVNQGNTQLQKGINVYYTITNNSATPVSDILPMFRFETNNQVATDELNRAGNMIYLNIGNQPFSGQSLLSGETATGFIHFDSIRDFEVSSISLVPNGHSDSDKFGTWNIQ